MSETTRSWLMRVLKVPPTPQPPGGAPDSLRIFRAARPFYRYKCFLWTARQLASAVGLCVGFIFVEMVLARLTYAPAAWVLRLVETFVWVAYFVQVPVTLAVLRLDFELRWYMVTDRSLRVREGILHLREKTMTFANIQEVAISQGPVQRMLGIADVRVRSAGGGSRGPAHESGGATESAHEAYFRGVSDAAAIRDVIRDRVRQYRDTGLGDPDAPAPAVLAPRVEAGSSPLDAAHVLLTEVRGLRQSLTPPRG
ncbi:PH domain-containing protein [Corallococcus sp. H22C18031201]|uniref:PH domain-containing protein n=1 Tax=Citreicoccus inhibens TaxID=2849499 RepID=UPI000E72595E|nr:PH domain-containing protein [Citreicoccus inhibens]MBU8896742.1 PH domain-containing protein [Citreicoccus inhibens]RJS21957.1 PH domain-containing protein [Corallococcus sp. H22C18031201]